VITTVGIIIYQNPKPDEPEPVSKTCTTYGGTLEEQCIEDYIGLTQKEATEKARQYGYIPGIVPVEIVLVDGVGVACAEVSGPFINLEVEDVSDPNSVIVGGYFECGR
jgi:hypothetical protein